MYSTLVYLLIIISLVIIALILLQPSRQQDTLSLLSTDKSNTLFETQKPRGMSYVLQYVTAILGIAWLILGLVLMTLGSH
ncbi:preprotein translocase subunit SecG [Lactococcus lactis]|uniref:preprotein translocase subunit SecG n=1 Tax=Lactococcus lactis TaxID=1358 RepID=UPI0038780237